MQGCWVVQFLVALKFQLTVWKVKAVSWPFLWQPESEGDGHAGLLLCILGRMGVEGVWSLSKPANVYLHCLAPAMKSCKGPTLSPAFLCIISWAIYSHSSLPFHLCFPLQYIGTSQQFPSALFRGINSMVFIRCLCWEQGDNAEEKIVIQTEDDGSWLGLLARKNFRLFFLLFFLQALFIFHWKNISSGFVIFMSWQGVFFIFNEQ